MARIRKMQSQGGCSTIDVIQLCIRRFTEEGNFWGSNSDELSLLSEVELATFQGVQNDGAKVLSEGDLCLVQAEDHMWKRGKVCNLLTGVHGARAELLLIDRGTLMTVPLRRCLPMPPELLEHPPLAQLYHLKGLKPCMLSSGVWSDQVMETFVELAGGSDVLVDANVEDGNAATLYTNIGGAMVSFNKCLLHGNLALPQVSDEVHTTLDDDNKHTDPGGAPAPKAANGGKFKCDHKSIVKGVYIEGRAVKPWWTLESSSFLPSIQKGLMSLRFQFPTVAQSYSWPYIWEGENVILVSPSGTGKTLSYLLPLLADSGTFSFSKGPSVLIVVGTSWQAKSVQLQAKRILSWVSAEKRFRCCCTYIRVESEAVRSFINGVDVVIGTPSSLLRQASKKSFSLKGIQKLVLDDGNDLCLKFSEDIRRIVSLCSPTVLNQVVITASEWSPLFHTMASVYTKCHVLVTNSSIEALIKAKTNMRVICSSESKRMSSVLDYLTEGRVIVCTSSIDEALAFQQTSQLHSWPCFCVKSEADCWKIEQALADSKLVVVCDDVLDSVLQHQLTFDHILHYSLPLSKSCFLRRLILFYPAFQKRIQCQCAVIVTDHDRSRAALFTGILKHLSQFVPKSLQNMADLFKKEKDVCRSSYDLCYHLKAWGYCRTNSCPCLHKLVISDAYTQETGPLPNVLPTSGVVEVKVCHVSNATRLWVSLIKHYPEGYGGECVPGSNPGTLVTLSLKLTRFYSEQENKQLQDHTSEGMYCCLEDSDGSFYRVRVLKFSHPLGFCFPHKEKARVRLIDFGSVQIVDLNQLLLIPDEFLKVPAQVTEVYMCGIKPRDKDSDWSEEAIQFSRRMLQGQVLCGKIALCSQSGQSMWLDPVEQRVKLTGISVTTALCNPIRELLKADFAEPNQDHLRDVQNTLGLATNALCPVKKISWCTLPLDADSEVYVSAVSSPNQFYVQLVKNHEQLDELEDKLNSTEMMQLSITVIPEGCLCAAQFPIDKQWYRGQVLKTSEDQCSVFFIDHGDTEWIPHHLVQHIDPLLLELPAQAIECSFPESNGPWTLDDGDVLWDLTRDGTLHAKVLGVSLSQSSDVIRHIVALKNPGSDTCLSVQLSEMIGLRPTLSETGQWSPSDDISSIVAGLMKGGTDSTKFAVMLEYWMISNPKLASDSFDQLLPLFKVIQDIEDVACVHILRGVSALVSTGLLSMTSGNRMEWVFMLLKRNDVQLLTHSLQLLKLIVDELHHISEVLQALCRLLKEWESESTITSPILDILSVVPKDGLDLKQMLLVAGVCCCIVLQGPVNRSCLELLDFLSADTRVASVIMSRLPFSLFIESIGNLLVAQDLGCLLLNTLWNLCQDDLYRDQVYKSKWWLKLPCSPVVIVLFKAMFDVDLVSSKPKVACAHPELARLNPKHVGQSICPKIKWSQQVLSLLLAVQLQGCEMKDLDVSFMPTAVSVRANVNEQYYRFDLNLYAAIAHEDCEVTTTALEILISLKKVSCELWPCLTAKNEKLPMISVDFDRWRDSLCDFESVPNWRDELKPVAQTQFLASSNSSSESDDEDSEVNDTLVNDLLDFGD